MPEMREGALETYEERLKKSFYCLVCGKAANRSQIERRADVCRHQRWIEEEPPADAGPLRR